MGWWLLLHRRERGRWGLLAGNDERRGGWPEQVQEDGQTRRYGQVRLQTQREASGDVWGLRSHAMGSTPPLTPFFTRSLTWNESAFFPLAFASSANCACNRQKKQGAKHAGSTEAHSPARQAEAEGMEQED